MPPLDRWRRAAGCVLEAVAIRGLSDHIQRKPREDWRWRGAAIHVVDTLAPDLNLASPDIALAVNTGDVGAHPRAGVAVLRAWQAKGHDPMQRVQYLLGGGVISAEEWLGLGEWILDPSGAAASLPVVCTRSEAMTVPGKLTPWSWRRVRCKSTPRGGKIGVEGAGGVSDGWIPAGVEGRTLAGATRAGCFLRLDPGGPVGIWEVASAQGFGQVMGARGITFAFKVSGAVDVILADAFVGPLASVSVAGEVGTSGVVEGRWQVVGAHSVGFS